MELSTIPTTDPFECSSIFVYSGPPTHEMLSAMKRVRTVTAPLDEATQTLKVIYATVLALSGDDDIPTAHTVLLTELQETVMLANDARKKMNNLHSKQLQELLGFSTAKIIDGYADSFFKLQSTDPSSPIVAGAGRSTDTFELFGCMPVELQDLV